MNAGQQIVFDYIQRVLGRREKTKEFIILDAPAGHGKTYLVNKIFKAAEEGDILIVAPTHKAKSLFPYYFKVATIHSFFKSEKEYTDEGEIIFNLKSPLIKTNIKLLIVDEASMVNSEMTEVFSTLSIPILFCCDRAQLPPVGEDISPIYKTTHTSFTLTENMRSDSSVVQPFRENVFNSFKSKIPVSRLQVSKDKVIKDFESKQDTIVLTWTNNRKNEWNNYIRRGIFKFDVLERFYKNESLVFTGFRTTFNDIKYNTSDIITIASVSKVSKELEYFPKSCDCPKDGVRKTKIIACKKCGILGHNVAGYSINFYKIIDQHDVEWYVPVEPKDEKAIQELLKHHKTYILNQTPKDRKLKGLWQVYYRFKETYWPTLDYIYASTTHKSQGSEWANVYVDYQNICWSDKQQTKFKEKLLYTAVSRMRKHLAIVEY